MGRQSDVSLSFHPHSRTLSVHISLNPHFCMRDFDRPVPVRRLFGLDEVGHASLEPGGNDSLGHNESLCGVDFSLIQCSSLG